MSETACAEAPSEGVSSADVVIDIVSQQRGPAPSITIMTPGALTLRHAPIADRARYGSLIPAKKDAPVHENLR